MEEWIKGLISAALRPVREIAQAAADRIAGVYNAFTSALGRVRRAAANWVGVGRAWANAMIRNALAVANRLRWLIVVEIPRRVSAGIDAAVRWAADRISAARALAEFLVGQLRAWALARINDLIATLTAVRDYLLRKVAEVALTARQLADRVFGPLGTPERLAAWILGPLITLLVAYWWANAERLAELAWRRRRQIELRALGLVDNIIDRIL